MRKIILTIAAAAFLLSACQKDLKNKPAVLTAINQQDEQMTTSQINNVIHEKFITTGAFDWKDASDLMLWSAVENSDKIVSVGYMPVGETDIDKRMASININDVKWKDAKQQVLDIVYENESKKNPTLIAANLEVWKEKRLPVIDVKIDNIETLKALRHSALVRYAEPMGYDPIAAEDAAAGAPSSGGGLFGGSGCGGYDGDNTLVNGTDYTVVLPNAKVSWNYSYHGIQNAWTKSTGAGIKVMVIDTGVSPDQDNLGSAFNQGLSTGRSIQKIFTMPGVTNSDDGCGHGTAMSGTVSAPRCTDGNSCGVAYNCNFVIDRAAQDVYIDQSVEVKGVSDGYTWAGDDSSVKIISMSLGRITSSGQIKDAINYAYGKGKLMFCAGGTSFSWTAGFVGVIFPASLPNVEAITGVQDTPTLKACEDCHKGKQIDFVVVMEKSNGGLHALTTATSGDVPTTVGGSSVSTATAAGIAALVWSKFPNYTRDDILNKLTTTSSNYPTKSKNYGWGILNADAATN